MMTEGAHALASGRSVLIFPEGTRKSPSDAIEFRRGIEIGSSLFHVGRASSTPPAMR